LPPFALRRLQFDDASLPTVFQGFRLSPIGFLVIGALTPSPLSAKDDCGEGRCDVKPRSAETVANEKTDADDKSKSEGEKKKDDGKAKDRQKLSKGEIKKLEGKGIDAEELKGGKATGKLDLYKDKEGNVFIHPKGGSGPGEPTGININDF
jgi:hypothetical protein